MTLQSNLYYNGSTEKLFQKLGECPADKIQFWNSSLQT